jgi:UDP-N-acetylglucosamine 1-carboxyvinyltransferase
MAKDKFLVQGLGGKKKLSGTIAVSGAKNSALKLMASSVLFKDTLLVHNIPDIEDVKRMSDLLVELGCTVKRNNHATYSFLCGNNAKTDLSSEISKRMRSSIVLSGPLLARFGEVSFPHPGGCIIGVRSIDFFIEGFQKMGARVSIRGKANKKIYVIKAPSRKLRGATIFLKTPSVTATETLMMAGVLATGTTVIQNAALEPEIKDLADFLNRSGATITGAGTTTITVRGGTLLSSRGKPYVTMPDRIETGSFVILGALCARDLLIKNCNPEHVTALLDALMSCGVSIKIGKTSIAIINNKQNRKQFKTVNIKTHEYPGFPTDLQAPMTVFLTQAKGEAMVFETIFEGRLNYTESLGDMGADITPMDPHRVLVKGPMALRGRKLQSPDLRAGLAFIIAAIVARGNSIIHNVYNVDRGYERIDERLRGIGVQIKRINGNGEI